MFPVDLSDTNENFSADVYQDMEKFEAFITDARNASGSRYLYGGYAEKRNMYRRSDLFGKAVEADAPARNIHLGVDIWGEAGTPVQAPLDGTVHSFAFNDNFGDYGATIILRHQVQEEIFFSLYGHLSLADIEGLTEGKEIQQGEIFAHFGPPGENGHWPPHLHFQLINDIANHKGDYPGVCSETEKDYYLANCPSPGAFILSYC